MLLYINIKDKSINKICIFATKSITLINIEKQIWQKYW